MIKVVVRDCATNEIIKEVECEGKDEAVKKERVLNANLDHEKYYTEILL